MARLRQSASSPKLLITTLAERPELGRGVWETASEAMADIPNDGDSPMSPGSYEVHDPDAF